MREKKLLFSLSLIFLLLFAGTVFAAGVVNWGDVVGTADVVPVVEEGDSYSSYYGNEKNLEFTAVGGIPSPWSPGFMTWNSPRAGGSFDAMIIRTTISSGDLEGIAWYDGWNEIDLEFVKDEEVSGDFILSNNIHLTDEESSDVTFSWDFDPGEIFMDGVLHAPEDENPLGGDTDASCDVGVVLLGDSNNPVFDILAGDTLLLQTQLAADGICRLDLLHKGHFFVGPFAGLGLIRSLPLVIRLGGHGKQPHSEA